MTTRSAGVHHRNLAARPSAHLFNGLARARVRRLRRLEKGKHMFCTQGRPQREVVVIPISKGSTAADGNEARVAHFGEDHDNLNLHPR